MGLATVGAVSLTGCVGAFDPQADASSPLAPRVQALVDANREYPRWADFPKSPTDLPTTVEVASRVNTVRATGGALAGEVSRIDWQLTDPEGFARDMEARVAASTPAPAPATVQTQAEIEALAERLRRRAAPPPPITRPPRP